MKKWGIYSVVVLICAVLLILAVKSCKTPTYEDVIKDDERLSETVSKISNRRRGFRETIDSIMSNYIPR